jgi:hypothetical protein
MITCRSIPDATWEQARKALIFFFTRRHGRNHAEDLAHDTLAAFWGRDDFEFEAEADFLRVCRAFAANVLKATQRKDYKQRTVELDLELHHSTGNAFGLNPTEMLVLLRETYEAKSRLSMRDRQSIQDIAEGVPTHPDPEQANRDRVRLHRARKRLERLLNWK